MMLLVPAGRKDGGKVVMMLILEWGKEDSYGDLCGLGVASPRKRDGESIHEENGMHTKGLEVLRKGGESVELRRGGDLVSVRCDC